MAIGLLSSTHFAQRCVAQAFSELKIHENPIDARHVAMRDVAEAAILHEMSVVGMLSEQDAVEIGRLAMLRFERFEAYTKFGMDPERFHGGDERFLTLAVGWARTGASCAALRVLMDQVGQLVDRPIRLADAERVLREVRGQTATRREFVAWVLPKLVGKDVDERIIRGTVGAMDGAEIYALRAE